jgi:hypothetical protein
MPAGTGGDEGSDAGAPHPAGSGAAPSASGATADGAKPHKHRDGGAPSAPVAAGEP